MLLQPLDWIWMTEREASSRAPCLDLSPKKVQLLLWRWKGHVLMEDQDSSCEHVKFGLPVGHLIR